MSRDHGRLCIGHGGKDDPLDYAKKILQLIFLYCLFYQCPILLQFLTWGIFYDVHNLIVQ